MTPYHYTAALRSILPKHSMRKSNCRLKRPGKVPVRHVPQAGTCGSDTWNVGASSQGNAWRGERAALHPPGRRCPSEKLGHCARGAGGGRRAGGTSCGRRLLPGGPRPCPRHQPKHSKLLCETVKTAAKRNRRTSTLAGKSYRRCAPTWAAKHVTVASVGPLRRVGLTTGAGGGGQSSANLNWGCNRTASRNTPLSPSRDRETNVQDGRV